MPLVLSAAVEGVSPAVWVAAFAGLFLLAGGLLLFSGGGPRFVRAWRLLRLPTFDADVPAGRSVVASGTIAALDGTLTAPLSGDPAVLYRDRDQAYVREGDADERRTDVLDETTRDSPGWQTRREDPAQVPFLLETDAGDVVVAADAAALDLPVTAMEHGSIIHRLGSRSSVLARLQTAVGGSPSRQVESRLAPGDRVTAIGGTIEPSDRPEADARLTGHDLLLSRRGR